MYYPDFFKGYIKNYFRDSNFSGVYTYEDGTKAQYQSKINLKAQESPQAPEGPITPTLPETKSELILEAPAGTQAAAASSEGCEEKGCGY